MVVIGAGFSGLVAACELQRAGVPVLVFEARKVVAGLGATHRDPDGFSHDVGMHIITNRLADALGLGATCRDVETFEESVLLGGRTLHYPFGLLIRPRYWGSAIASRARRTLQPRPQETVADFFRQFMGERLASEVAIPLVEKMLGTPARELSPAAAQRLPGVLRTIYLMAARRLTGRLVAIGYCHELPESARVWHVYPRDGIATLCSSLAERLPDQVHLETRVERLRIASGEDPIVEVNGDHIRASAVVSSIALSQLARITVGAPGLEAYRGFRYRSLVLVNLKLRGRSLLPTPALWTPEPDWPFFRLNEAPAAMPWLAPADHTMITADIGAWTGDPLWRCDDETLADQCLAHLARLVPDARSRFRGARVVRARLGYPVPLTRYEGARRRLRAGLDLPGLFTIGRNGEFCHALMEDVYLRTRARIPEILRHVRPALPRGLARSLPSAHVARPWSTRGRAEGMRP